MHWTIFCPGPSLREWEAVDYDPKRSIAVNGAILQFSDVAYWAMLDYEVFGLCAQQMAGRAIKRNLKLWVPENWLTHMHKWAPEVLPVFKLFGCETFPGQDLRGMMPFGQACNWHIYTTFSAMALAILKGAKKIKIYGADMSGVGYFKNSLENARTNHKNSRWEGERRLFELLVNECKKHNVEIARL